LAIETGLNLPLVFNCGGYESEEVLELLDGIIDIYMPDAKFSTDEVAKKFCNVEDYFSNLKNILKLMHTQVGDLKIVDGTAKRGLLIRHLVMPNDMAGIKDIMEFIAKELSPDTFINIMEQYRPCGESYKFREISRPITQKEFENAMEIASSFGLHRFG
jgi:putative pyruvate formate lyase activating enzyme